MTAPIDHHLENLGTYLKERLNEAGQALDPAITVVKGLTYLVDFTAADEFPLLQIFKNSGTGWADDETQEWEINYCLTNYGDPYEVARIFAWVNEGYDHSNIRGLLVDYFSVDRCGIRLDKTSIRWAYGYRILGANRVPTLRVTFTLTS